MNTHPQFSETLLALGKTDNERAAALGVSRMTLAQLKAGRYPRSIPILLPRPQLLRALSADAEAAQTTDQQAA